ncbi:MAG: hypothetical protein M5R42_16805 [Rhodocyclaceae bacterium]|nr:hypothetical protein [Rhodocyclaceae bacterium]
MPSTAPQKPKPRCTPSSSRRPSYSPGPRPSSCTACESATHESKGKIEWESDEQVIRLIRKHLPELADVLIATVEKPSKDGLAALAVADLKRIGVTVTDAGDQVPSKPADSALDKMVDALLKGRHRGGARMNIYIDVPVKFSAGAYRHASTSAAHPARWTQRRPCATRRRNTWPAARSRAARYRAERARGVRGGWRSTASRSATGRRARNDRQPTHRRTAEAAAVLPGRSAGRAASDHGNGRRPGSHLQGLSVYNVEAGQGFDFRGPVVQVFLEP